MDTLELDLSKWHDAKYHFQKTLMVQDKNKNLCPKLCDIHERFGSFDSLEHNCLGCNFAEATLLIHYFFERVDYYHSVHDAYSEYIFRLYLLVEKSSEVFKIIELPQKYQDKNLKTFSLIRKWANFIKHPKAFMFSHHPKFYLEGDKTQNEATIINSEFIKEFWAGGNNNKKLFDKLSNNSCIAVVFPSPEKLMEDFAKEVSILESIICENQVYREILKECSTLKNYFESLDKEES